MVEKYERDSSTGPLRMEYLKFERGLMAYAYARVGHAV